jgi:predicted transcriptional regulator of viral defense system
MYKRAKPNALAQFAESLQSKGRYSFTKEEAQKSLKISDNAFRLASLRLIKQLKILRIKNSFYVTVPPEFRAAGGPPALSYIDDLMKFLKQPYYVGLLSAAAQFSASHQAVQELQVITSKPVRTIICGRSRIRFFTKKTISESAVTQINTRTGVVTMSTPEATAFDLIRYYRAAGHMSHVATVLAELSEKIDTHKLLRAAKQEADVATVQRLGYLIDKFSKSEAAKLLHLWLSKQDLKIINLTPGIGGRPLSHSKKWHLVVNDLIEPDL